MIATADQIACFFRKTLVPGVTYLKNSTGNARQSSYSLLYNSNCVGTLGTSLALTNVYNLNPIYNVEIMFVKGRWLNKLKGKRGR